MDANQMKEAAAKYTVDNFVKSNTVIGLGTGSTASFAVKYLAQKLKNKELENIRGVPTSEETDALAKQCGIEIISRSAVENLDLAIDGADEVDDNLNLVKGRGGALLREKLVEDGSHLIIMADHSKIYPKLCLNGAVPVEIVQFSYEHVIKKLLSLPNVKDKCTTKMRKSANNSDKNYVTDNGNFIVDLFFSSLDCEPDILASELSSVVGVVEHGLFINVAKACVCADPSGNVKVINKK